MERDQRISKLRIQQLIGPQKTEYIMMISLIFRVYKSQFISAHSVEKVFVVISYLFFILPFFLFLLFFAGITNVLGMIFPRGTAKLKVKKKKI